MWCVYCAAQLTHRFLRGVEPLPYLIGRLREAGRKAVDPAYAAEERARDRNEAIEDAKGSMIVGRAPKRTPGDRR